MFPCSLVNTPQTKHGLNNESPSLIPTSSRPQRLCWDRQPGLQLVLADDQRWKSFCIREQNKQSNAFCVDLQGP